MRSSMRRKRVSKPPSIRGSHRADRGGRHAWLYTWLSSSRHRRRLAHSPPRQRVRHTDNLVFVRAWVDRLPRPRYGETFDVDGIIKVDRPARPRLYGAGAWEASFDEHRTREGDDLFILDKEHEELVGCSGKHNAGFKARANYDADRVTIIIPRTCLAPRHLEHGRGMGTGRGHRRARHPIPQPLVCRPTHHHVSPIGATRC
jgi:hypothetical protein